VVLIHIRERKQTVIDTVRARGYTGTVALDEDDEAVEAFQISGTPTVVLLNPRGQVIGRAVGTQAWTSPAGRRLLNELLNH
jgi:hypothetical protein